MLGYFLLDDRRIQGGKMSRFCEMAILKFYYHLEFSLLSAILFLKPTIKLRLQLP